MFVITEKIMKRPVYINKILYIVSTPTSFNASTSSSGSLNLVLR